MPKDATNVEKSYTLVEIKDTYFPNREIDLLGGETANEDVDVTRKALSELVSKALNQSEDSEKIE